jgi:hypothetical protein
MRLPSFTYHGAGLQGLSMHLKESWKTWVNGLGQYMGTVLMVKGNKRAERGSRGGLSQHRR